MRNIKSSDLENNYITKLIFTCDNCGQEIDIEEEDGSVHLLINELRTIMIEEGWKYGTLGDNEGIFCPDCIQEEGVK